MEDGNVTTLAVGEEGDDDVTTLAFGEEGDDTPVTTDAVGEEGDDTPVTTAAVGEEGDDTGYEEPSEHDDEELFTSDAADDGDGDYSAPEDTDDAGYLGPV